MTAHEQLLSIHAALNQIEVRGRGNLNTLLGAISALEDIMQRISDGSVILAAKDNEEEADG